MKSTMMRSCRLDDDGEGRQSLSQLRRQLPLHKGAFERINDHLLE